MDHAIDTDRHAVLLARGAAPDLATARKAAAEGRLWAVDTASAGYDSLVEANSAGEALTEVADYAGHALPPDAWSADRVTAIHATWSAYGR